MVNANAEKKQERSSLGVKAEEGSILPAKISENYESLGLLSLMELANDKNKTANYFFCNGNIFLLKNYEEKTIIAINMRTLNKEFFEPDTLVMECRFRKN